ncbi:AAA domain-containing protein, putative AbiEii toxin, Type IV TA system [Pseudomonas sp. NFACC24-1]|uniref:ATP-dependent nuclease n=1 Tax=Pseudomonas sp. NFACC24-1 TaxID=1566189 RepID=UPI0008EE115D|nr:AAA family ATPase [Pseudomonas sp. NFACC24-1]SFO39663.1 AAA domain-containing protein, putative AbiEii toxin, Type IV TA system [Pseudomonas sp. NFACC24-1]
MKKAAIADYWNRLKDVPVAAKGIISLKQFIPGSADREFATGGIFAVVGANGAGKSSFFSYLTDLSYNRIEFYRHEVLLHNGEIINFPGGALPAIVTEPLSDLRTANATLVNFKSTFGQGGIAELPDKELSLVNYVLGSSYDSICIEEVVTGDDESCPRFVFIKNGHEHDNFTASMGEQLVLFIYWILSKKYNRPGVFFLEEPETGLTPAAQDRIVDLLAYLSSDRKKQLFLATHSPFIVSKLGAERVIVMKRPEVAHWGAALNDNYLNELGVAPVRKGVFFLEDNKAKVFFEKLLDMYGSNIRKTHEIIFLNGESHVYEVVIRYAKQSENFAIKGIIDADQKGVVKYTENVFDFLPGSLAPEEELMSAVQSDMNGFARKLGVRPDKVADAIRLCQGYELHDKFEEISKKIYGVVKTIVYETAFLLWFEQYQAKQEIHDFMRTIDPELTADDIEVVRSQYP